MFSGTCKTVRFGWSTFCDYVFLVFLCFIFLFCCCCREMRWNNELRCINGSNLINLQLPFAAEAVWYCNNNFWANNEPSWLLFCVFPCSGQFLVHNCRTISFLKLLSNGKKNFATKMLMIFLIEICTANRHFKGCIKRDFFFMFVADRLGLAYLLMDMAIRY